MSLTAFGSSTRLEKQSDKSWLIKRCNFRARALRVNGKSTICRGNYKICNKKGIQPKAVA